MKHSRIKPISFVKANAADLICEQETLALLKILALGNRQIEEGRVVPAADAFRALRKRTRHR